MHEPGKLLLLPNAWDLTSARVLERAGFAAIGTTSLATAFGAGVPDGAGVTRDQTLDLATQLGGLDALVTVDVEGGFSEDPVDVAEIVRVLVGSGAVGFNIEDGQQEGTLVPVEVQVDKIRACREANADIFINARVDTYWVGSARGDAAAAEVLERARRYVDAGADGIFIPALSDLEQIREFCDAIAVPVNVLYSPSGCTVNELNAALVGRLSTGSYLFRNAASSTVDAIKGIAGGGLPGAGIPGYAQFAG